MSQSIGDRVSEQAIAEYKTLRVTGQINPMLSQQDTFQAGYMKGFLQAQTEFIEQMKGKLK